MSRLSILVAVGLGLFAGSLLSPSAMAQEVYNFQFVPETPKKKTHRVVHRAIRPAPGAQASPVAAPAPAIISPPPSAPIVEAVPVVETVTPAPAVVATQSKIEPLEPATYKWRATVGSGKFINYAEEAQGLALGIERELDTHFALQAGSIIGRTSRRWDPSLSSETLVSTTSLGASWTPYRLRTPVIESVSAAILAGLLTTRGHTDDTIANFQLAPYLGLGLTLQFSARISAVAELRFERADTDFGQALGGLAVTF